MKKLWLILSLVGLAVIFTGCADPVVMSEVFQLKEGEKLYTAYNLWYEKNDDISCLNIQRGTFLPIGTEIEPVNTDRWTDSITFKDKSGKLYVIKFDPGKRLCTMQDFIAYTFTTKKLEEQMKGIPKINAKRIARGEVVPGMTRKEVLLAYGPPPALRTPNLRNETWIYWINEQATVRVVFRGDKVSNMLNINFR